MEFEWNTKKAASNLVKHRVSFNEAVTVFGDPWYARINDITHSEEEHREIIVGHSDKDRLLLVCFTERNDVVRIISARNVTNKERTKHEYNQNI